MGHTRLGTIPKSKRWLEIVREATSTGDPSGEVPLANDIENIASQTLQAAQEGLKQAIDDIGLQYTFFMLTQTVLAAREEDWYDQLARLGMRISETDSLFDFTAELQGAIDDYLLRNGRQTDISELAQKAAGEAIFALAVPRTFTLFGGEGDDLRLAIKALSTKAGFGKLGQAFFGRFMTRFLNFYLSRVTATAVNGPRLLQTGDISEFNQALERHCHQSARIVRDFSAEWYSKTEYLKGIDLDNTSGFMAVALTKLQDELKQQGRGQ